MAALVVMRKRGAAYLVLAFALLLLAMFILLPSGAGPGALEREMGFWGRLQSSLYHIDEAKMKWADEKHKTDGEVPTMGELAPYLGDWTNDVAQLAAWGVTFKITPVSEMNPQSDVATLTRDLRFERGFRRYYRAGTKFSIQGEHFSPPYDTKSWLIAVYQNNRGRFAVVLFGLAVANLVAFVIKRARQVRHKCSTAHEPQKA